MFVYKYPKAKNVDLIDCLIKMFAAISYHTKVKRL